MSGTRDQQAPFTRQAAILRKNLFEWDRMLRNPRGEDFPSMLGRLNAANNQTANLDRQIEDVLEHFVYLPKQAPANPQDIPFFLSTRIEAASSSKNPKKKKNNEEEEEEEEEEEVEIKGEAVQVLNQYESAAAKVAAEYEANMVRF